MSYLLDTNIFICSKNELPMDIFHGFWQRLADLAHAGQIFSSVKVKVEIDRGNDELKQWCNDQLPKEFFLPFEAYEEYARLMTWANGNPVFSVPAKQEFATVADGYLVATAAAKGMKVVTFETWQSWFTFFSPRVPHPIQQEVLFILLSHVSHLQTVYGPNIQRLFIYIIFLIKGHEYPVEQVLSPS